MKNITDNIGGIAFQVFKILCWGLLAIFGLLIFAVFFIALFGKKDSASSKTASLLAKFGLQKTPKITFYYDEEYTQKVAEMTDKKLFEFVPKFDFTKSGIDFIKDKKYQNGYFSNGDFVADCTDNNGAIKVISFTHESFYREVDITNMPKMRI